MHSEYDMLRIYRPMDLVHDHERDQYSQDLSRSSQETVMIDRSRLSDSEYLQSLKNQANSNKEIKTMGREEYVQLELEKTDMFLFVKYVNPTLYKRHFGHEDEDEKEEERMAAEDNQQYSAQIESAQLLFNSANQKSKSKPSGFARNLIKSLRSYIRYRFQSLEQSDESK